MCEQWVLIGYRIVIFTVMGIMMEESSHRIDLTGKKRDDASRSECKDRHNTQVHSQTPAIKQFAPFSSISGTHSLQSL